LRQDKTLFTHQTAVAMFVDFAVRYKLKSVDIHAYHETNLPNHPYFTFISLTLTLYRRLIGEILSNFRASINLLDFSKHMSPLHNTSRSSNRNLNSSLDFDRKLLHNLERHAQYSDDSDTTSTSSSDSDSSDSSSKKKRRNKRKQRRKAVELSPSPIKITEKRAISPQRLALDLEDLTNATPIEDRVSSYELEYEFVQQVTSTVPALKSIPILRKIESDTSSSSESDYNSDSERATVIQISPRRVERIIEQKHVEPELIVQEVVDVKQIVVEKSVTEERIDTTTTTVELEAKPEVTTRERRDTPHPKALEKELKKIDPNIPKELLSRKTTLPFDIDMMIRNAEWRDIKLENFDDVSS
jgi:hypothetical protein